MHRYLCGAIHAFEPAPGVEERAIKIIDRLMRSVSATQTVLGTGELVSVAYTKHSRSIVLYIGTHGNFIQIKANDAGVVAKAPGLVHLVRLDKAHELDVADLFPLPANLDNVVVPQFGFPDPPPH